MENVEKDDEVQDIFPVVYIRIRLSLANYTDWRKGISK